MRLWYPFAELEIDDELHLSIDGKSLEPQNRLLGELRPVLYDPEGVPAGDETVLYRMYRDAALDHGRDRQLFSKNGVRFDITVLASLDLGPEQNKTLGHYHPKAEGDLSYPEVYQVLSGNATFLLQKKGGNAIADFVVVAAAKGDALLIPPNYGHVTVNSGDGPLVLSNLVSDRFSSLYAEYVEKRGAAYYMLKGNGLTPNSRYGSLPAPRFAGKNLSVSRDIYMDFVSCPSCFGYLNTPSVLGKSDWFTA